jgi:hypothetical protein
VVAAPALTGRRARAAVLAAAAALVVLALHGRWPDPDAVVPAGLMLDLPPERVRAVRLASVEQTWRFVRVAGGWASAAGGGAAGSDPGEHLERGLRSLHALAPERLMSRDEQSGVAARDFGLDPPRYSVTVEGDRGRTFTAHFGGLNPQGRSMYLRVAGRPELFLVARSLGEPWEFLLALP